MCKNIFISIFLVFLFSFLQSCASWYTLQFDTVQQPIQFGALQIETELDTLGLISGFSEHHFEEGTYAESQHISIVFDGKDEISENLNRTIYSALDDDPAHFIGDGEIIIEVEHGISFGAIFLGMIAGWITDEQAEYGSHSIESIDYNGVVYKLKNSTAGE